MPSCASEAPCPNLLPTPNPNQVLTLNANLGIRGFQGGALTFRGTRGVDERPKEVRPVSSIDFCD